MDDCDIVLWVFNVGYIASITHIQLAVTDYNILDDIGYMSWVVYRIIDV